MNKVRIAAGLSLTMGLILAGCVHENGPTPSPPQPAAGTGVPQGVTNAQNAADLRIADDIAGARCDRAGACNDIGNGQMYVSRQLCMDQVRGSIANELTGYTCPRGLDTGSVDHCLAAIRRGECGKSPKLSSIPECKADGLCLN